MSDTPATISADDIAPAALPPPTSPAVKAGSPPQATPDGANTAATSGEASPAIDTTQPAPGTLDAKGTAFDPSRHIPRTHPRTGAWMPRGGRKPGVTPPASSTPGTSQSAPSTPQPESYIPAEGPPPPSTAEPKPGAPEIDHSDDAGEVVCSSVEVIAGIIFDAPEDCTPPVSEHKNMVRATAAYIRARGWQASAGVGLLLMFGAYLLRVLRKPKPNATVRRWVGLDRAAERAKDVTPEAARPSAPVSAAPHRGAEIIDLPAHVPPLAKS